jgi:uncharacterized spore protein YtfJ
MEQIREILEAMGAQLSGVANGEAVVGSPIKVGSVTLYPVSRISVGLGGGGGEGEADGVKGPKLGVGVKFGPGSGMGSGGGAGGGAKARPVAVLAFSEGNVSVLPIPDKKGRLDQLLDKIPDLIAMVKFKRAAE